MKAYKVAHIKFSLTISLFYIYSYIIPQAKSVHIFKRKYHNVFSRGCFLTFTGMSTWVAAFSLFIPKDSTGLWTTGWKPLFKGSFVPGKERCEQVAKKTRIGNKALMHRKKQYGIHLICFSIQQIFITIACNWLAENIYYDLCIC